jgi:hypothetical protein
MNTIFNIVPQGHKHVVERFGRLHNVVCNDVMKRVLVLPWCCFGRLRTY